MPGRGCYHGAQWIETGKPHDCWFVRPKARQVRKTISTSKVKVEPPLTDWLEQAYTASETLGGRGRSRVAVGKKKRPRAG